MFDLKIGWLWAWQLWYINSIRKSLLERHRRRLWTNCLIEPNNSLFFHLIFRSCESPTRTSAHSFNYSQGFFVDTILFYSYTCSLSPSFRISIYLKWEIKLLAHILESVTASSKQDAFVSLIGLRLCDSLVKLWPNLLLLLVYFLSLFCWKPSHIRKPL